MIRLICLCALISQPVAHTPPKPKIVTFPDMVKKSPLVAPKAEELNRYQEALKLLEEEGFTTQAQKDKAEKPEKTNSGQAQRAYPTLFKTKINPKSKYQIQIPATGEFKLVVKEGTGFSVVDNDATDGTASITMPRGTLKTAIQMHGAKSQNSQMEVNDPLYHLKDVLDTRQWDKWMDIGLRPVPVPTDWRSEDGNDFVLRFKSQAIQSFHMVWQSVTEKAPFPPGINEIGPEGGTVELPGIGKIELPEGALTETITVKLSQQKEASKIILASTDFSEPYIYNGKVIEPFTLYYDFASPMLKVEPLNLELEKEASVYLVTDMNRVGNNDPRRVLEWMSVSHPFAEINIGKHLFFDSKKREIPGESRPSLFKRFNYIVKVIREDFKPNSNIQSDSSANAMFNISEESSSCSPVDNEVFFLDTPWSGVDLKADTLFFG